MALTALSNSTKKTNLPPSDSRLFVCAVLLAFVCVCFFLGACQKSRRTPAQNAAAVHDATREFAAAARKSTPLGTAIRIKLQPSPNRQNLPDLVEITLFSDGSLADRKTSTAQVLGALNAAAQKRGLQVENRSDQQNVSSISFGSASGITHSIKIKFAGTQAPANKPSAAGDIPKLAIILDDFGSDRGAAESVFAMPYPLTLSILPNHDHSREIAEEALHRGYQVMLHLPMQSVANESPEKEELHSGMSSAQMQQMLSEMMESVPDAAGVNNHQGSEATSDAALMNTLMVELRNWNLFYVDSRTTAATVAFDAAQREGIPAAFRNVPFLDDVQDTTAITKQLKLALKGAKEKKAAVAIGHPHPATLTALREFLPKAKANGVRLVFVSELVH